MWRSACIALAHHAKLNSKALVKCCLQPKTTDYQLRQEFQRAFCTPRNVQYCSSSCGTPHTIRALHQQGFAFCGHQTTLDSRATLRLRNMGKLKVQSPVPSDIVIAQAIKPIHIAEVAHSIGLSPDEYDLYGTTKAKVSHAWKHGKSPTWQRSAWALHGLGDVVDPIIRHSSLPAGQTECIEQTSICYQWTLW